MTADSKLILIGAVVCGVVGIIIIITVGLEGIGSVNGKTGIPNGEQLQMVGVKGPLERLGDLLNFTTPSTTTTTTTTLSNTSTGQTNEFGIQPEDRFTITDPNEGKGIPPVKILSQKSEYDHALSGDLLLRITGEVINPTGEMCCASGDDVWMVATFFDANNQVLGSEVGNIDYDPKFTGHAMNPNQVYTYEIQVADVYDIPLDKLAAYSLEVDWVPPSTFTND